MVLLVFVRKNRYRGCLAYQKQTRIITRKGNSGKANRCQSQEIYRMDTITTGFRNFGVVRQPKPANPNSLL